METMEFQRTLGHTCSISCFSFSLFCDKSVVLERLPQLGIRNLLDIIYCKFELERWCLFISVHFPRLKH